MRYNLKMLYVHKSPICSCNNDSNVKKKILLICITHINGDWNDELLNQSYSSTKKSYLTVCSSLLVSCRINSFMKM